MRLMMLNAMKFCEQFRWIDVKSARESLRNTGELGQHFGPLTRERRHADGIPKFGAQPRVGIARHSDVMNLRRRQAGLFEAIANRSRRKSGCVLHAIEALFFDSGNELAVANDSCRSVAVIGVYAKNVHRRMKQFT